MPEKTKWELPDKRTVEQRGPIWVVYPPRKGYMEFVGSAEDCWDYLVKRGIIPDREEKE